MSKYRIITFDGGGALGSISMRLLQRLVNEASGLLDDVSLLAGTSVGSMNALSLAVGLSPTEAMLLYSKAVMALLFGPYPTLPSQRGVNRPLYSDYLEVIGKLLPVDYPLSKLDTSVLCPSFELENRATGSWQPVYYNNLSNSDNADTSILDVAYRSGAAPIYWPSSDGFIDGWVVANNPCTAALAAAVDPEQGGQRLEDVRIISFGIGRPVQCVAGEKQEWGAEQWLNSDRESRRDSSMILPPLLDILFFTSSEVNSSYCEKILGPQSFLRVNAPLNRPIPMDDWESIPEMIEQADAADIQPYVNWIESNWV